MQKKEVESTNQSITCQYKIQSLERNLNWIWKLEKSFDISGCKNNQNGHYNVLNGQPHAETIPIEFRQ